MVLDRINLPVAGGNEGGERGRRVPLEEEAEPGAGTVTAALPCLRGCACSGLGVIFPIFRSSLKPDTKWPPLGWSACCNSRPVFNIQIIKFPPINPLLLIILKGLTIRRQYSAIDFRWRRMAVISPRRDALRGVLPLLCSFRGGAMPLPSPAPRAPAAPR